MVLVTKDLDKFKEYATFCRVGTFSSKLVEDGVEVRIMTGKLGYIGTFPKDEATDKFPENLKTLLDWCKLSGFIEVEQSIPDEIFHG